MRSATHVQAVSTRAGSMRFPDLAEDLILSICQQLNAVSLCSLACTCRKLRVLSESPQLWSDLAHRRWHHPHSHLVSRHCSTQQPESPQGPQAAAEEPAATLLFAEGQEHTWKHLYLQVCFCALHRETENAAHEEGLSVASALAG